MIIVELYIIYYINITARIGSASSLLVFFQQVDSKDGTQWYDHVFMAVYFCTIASSYIQYMYMDGRTGR